MSRSPIEYIQEALTSRFTAEFSGGPLAGKVYNHLPEGTLPPYLYMESWNLTSDEVKGGNGSPFKVTGVIHLYSNTTGSQECQQLTDDTVQAVTLDTLDLSANDFNNFMVSIVSVNIGPESDSTEIRWHGALQFEWRIQDIT